MQRLTVHLTNVQKTQVNNKTKLFNTLSFKLKNSSQKEVNNCLEIAKNLGQVKKSFISNVK